MTDNFELKSKNSAVIYISAILFSVALLIFMFLAYNVAIEKNFTLDNAVLKFATSLTSPFLVKLMNVVTFFGSSAFLLPTYILIIVYFIIKKDKFSVLNIGFISVGSAIFTNFLKNYFQRTRPESSLIKSLINYSFPSGHSISAAVLFGILTFLLWQTSLSKIRKYTISFLFLFFALMIGLSRIILRVHYATDVIAGYCLGIAWLIFCFWILKFLFGKFSRTSKMSQ
ncbi:phosphatase PAP2 family protein [Halpernia frigidisoli]|uniref:Undecaprenyl-diphosphatase n=1 Tax=Halpernia frigidisoli TaxID=1125876 RepID=A0A1I3CSM4_9FLAO|nr:phosphatase PAP2 family protein [Halpernia frigidisoli]SFH77544.1 undecaprenyl-diphosphatase [Halpernia frigidisoli]